MTSKLNNIDVLNTTKKNESKFFFQNDITKRKLTFAGADDLSVKIFKDMSESDDIMNSKKNTNCNTGDLTVNQRRFKSMHQDFKRKFTI